MRAACVIILASLTVFMSPGTQAQTLPGEGDPSPDELLQLLRSMLTQMEDEDNANGEQTEWLEKRQHPGKREEEDSGRLRRQHPGKRLSLEQVMLEEPNTQSELSKRQHPGKRYLMLLHKRRELQEAEGDFSDLPKRQHPGKRLELLDRSGAEEKRQHPGKRLELEDDLTERE
ncbi:pro-thyrotropin-releasing hormone-like [Sinocyclocheilus grahami]|uniref:Pro-thyrotropin-releasing hormone n=1 Tax=Sinocyclocheilus grahami TaxID=75366 RepID=A0A672SC05_SINGR|nr:PREDICTED: pro-thyrotropin-releasing hormone-like [Sinocyclocheilus grahami]